MTDPSPAAIEAAAEAIKRHGNVIVINKRSICTECGEPSTEFHRPRAALAAAMPIIRAELAAEIEAAIENPTDPPVDAYHYDGSTEAEFVKWLVEVIHYPFDINFRNNPPPVDHDLIAAHWNTWDGWKVTDEEARETIRNECGK